ncbi:ABC transporter ATP-binding protein [Ancylobacter terrae]|uniref:ABC transporter ATP-binding protein n=1 Tax=Ancylobacter sp. sgz301288 TaxID=3342077 RepID=UPI00385AC2D3
MSAPLLQVEGLDAWYGAAPVLRGVGLSVNAGEVVALLGRNGAGKSTTMKALIGLVGRRAARLNFDGHDLRALPTHAIVRLGLGYVPEDRRIFTDLTVAENLDVGRRRASAFTRGGPPEWTVERVFELFPSLAVMKDRPGGRMSGGEQQMLTVARTLMGNPRLLLLDEPSEGVAPLVVEQMAQAVVRLKQAGVALLLSEQNLDFCGRVADRAVVLESGEVTWTGGFHALRADPVRLEGLLAV